MIKKLQRLFTARSKKEDNVIENWNDAGQPVPPPHLVKQNIIKKLQQQFNYDLFIETGTYMGDMVEAQKKNFKEIISIELGEKLYSDAVYRFKNDKHVKILQGDSGDILAKLCADIDRPAIFWLDGHYSGGITAMGKKECPIFEELSAILSAKPFNHILLIDDARLFVGANDYPTLEKLNDFITEYNLSAKIYTEYDIIHVIL
ncbi:hypothetical protein [Mucilaginibacter flavus]|uniref:hypothetical protein n=1 Tax=Mucilaginibacter flavus TaxID=931504 RepID=UPI0025B4938E|nr:hypothetical protein [Mucilaginibacter flavus]MDN3584402.1 hypothetical protein [Mucilaginibacter flavus]